MKRWDFLEVNGGQMEFDERLMMEAELSEANCALNHKDAIPSAVDYIIQKFLDYTLTIPVCKECVQKLQSDDWVLLYCTTCCESCWIYKPNSKKPWLYEEGEHVRWMDQCPVCYYESMDESIEASD